MILDDEEDLSPSTEDERAAMIASVLRDQERRESIRAVTPAMESGATLPQLVALALSSVLAVYVWFGSPGWLGPEPVPLPPVEVEESTLRLEMFIQAQAIEDYRQRNGRTPAFLAEVGPSRPGISYRRVDGRSYLLQGTGDRVQLTYSSRDSLAPFLGPGGEALLKKGEAQ